MDKLYLRLCESSCPLSFLYLLFCPSVHLFPADFVKMIPFVADVMHETHKQTEEIKVDMLRPICPVLTRGLFRREASSASWLAMKEMSRNSFISPFFLLLSFLKMIRMNYSCIKRGIKNAKTNSTLNTLFLM